MAFLSASFPLTALALLAGWSGGGGAVTGDCFLLGPRDGCLVSGWLAAGDLLDATSERRESVCEPLPEGGAWEESLEAPCEEEERLFGSLSSFLSPAAPLSLSAGAFVSFLSRGGEGEEEEEEVELEEEEALRG